MHGNGSTNPILTATWATLAGLTNLVAWVQSVDLGAWVSALTVAGLGLVTGVLFGLDRIANWRNERAKQDAKARIELEELNKGTLSKELERTNRQLEKLRATNHRIVNEQAAERLQHREEVERLMRQIESLHRTIQVLQREHHMIGRDAHQGRVAAEETRELIKGSSEIIPTPPDLRQPKDRD